MTILKPDYEACFKEGFKLATRLTRSKISYMRAKDASLLGDEAMANHYREYGKTWSDMRALIKCLAWVELKDYR